MVELLDNSDSSDDEQNLHINEKYANLYQRTEVLKDLRRAKDLGKDDEVDESSESETEDEDAELLSSTIDVKIIETINSLRKKDPKIYDNSTVWFERPSSDNSDDELQINSNTHKKKFKDVLREQLLTQGADIDEDDVGLKRDAKSSGRFNYDQEQEQIRLAFLASASEFENTSQSLDIFGTEKSTKSNDNSDDKKLVHALSEMKKLAPNDDPDKEDFLTKYMEHKMWKPKSHSKRDKEKTNVEESESDYEEEEKELDEVDKFESKYNFRFEELQENDMVQGVQVMGHSRTVDGSVRRVDERRKLQREQRIERKEKEKRQKEAELRRLKNLKRQELRERLQKIGEISGLKKLGFIDEDMLDDDWDPAKHEAMMNQQFNEDYYGEEDENLLHPDEIDGGDYNDDEDLNFDDSQYFNNNEGEEEERGGSDEADDQPIGNADAVNVVKKMKNELYELDFEDIVAGMPCRFKYTQVQPEDFGLSIDEILLADDSELNKFVSLKHISAYSTHRADQKDYSKKRKRLRAELRARAALIEEESAGGEEKNASKPVQLLQQAATTEVVKNKDTDVREDGMKKKRRRRRKDGEKNSTVDKAADQTVEEVTAAVITTDQKQTVKRSQVTQPSASQQNKQQRGWKQRGSKDRKKNVTTEKPPSRLALYK